MQLKPYLKLSLISTVPDKDSFISLFIIRIRYELVQYKLKPYILIDWEEPCIIVGS